MESITAQFKFTFGIDGEIKDTEAVASKAHEHAPREKQADLLQHAEELEAMKLWQSDDQPPMVKPAYSIESEE